MMDTNSNLSFLTAESTTCSIQKLHQAVDGKTPSTITCLDFDEVSSNGDMVSRVAVGVKCTYTYFCPNDNETSAAPKTAEATCNETGVWVGKKPLCHSQQQWVSLKTHFLLISCWKIEKSFWP